VTTKAQHAAQARYDLTRPPPVSVRLTTAQLAWLDSLRHPGEARSSALKRIAGVPVV